MTPHDNLAQGRWHEMKLCEQMGNIGSEVSRAINWKKKENQDQAEKALDRAFELFDLTLDDNKYKKMPAKLKEIARAREVVADFFCGSNEYKSDVDFLNKYFYYFGVAARN